MKTKICFLLSLFLMTALGAVPSFAEDDDATMAANLDQLISDYKALTITTGEYPGMTPASAVATFKDAITEAETNAAASTTTEEKAAISKKLTAAYQTCINTVNPIVNGGVYYIINDNSKIAAAGKEDKAMYIDTTNKRVAWAKKVADDDTYAFQITVNDDGTYYFKNIKTGLYTGNGGYTTAMASSTTPVKMTMHCYNGTGSYYIKDAGGWTLCPQGNANGTNDGPSYVWGWNGEGLSGGNVAHAEWTWRLEPYYTESSLDELVTKYKAMALTSGENPGTFTAAAVEKFNAAITAAETAATSGTADEKIAACLALDEAYANCVNTVNPIVNGGIYYVVNDNSKIAAAGKEDKAMYIDATNSRVAWAKKVADDNTYAFQITVNDDGTYYLKGVKTGLYTGSASSACAIVPVSDTPNSLTMHCYAGTGSYYIKGEKVNGTAWTYCPRGNADGTADGPYYVWTWNGETTSGGDVAHAEWTWRFEPFYTSTTLATLVSSYKTKAQSFVAGDCPGMVTAAALEAFNTAVTEAETMLANGTAAENAAVYTKLENAYQACVSSIHPIVNGGVYYLVNDNSKIATAGKDDKAMYVEANKKTVRWASKKADCAYAFQITVNDDNTYCLKNVYTGLYTGSSTAMYGTVPASSEPVKLTIHAYEGTGSYYIKGAKVNGTSWTYCPQGNANGTNDGPNNVWAYNGETTTGGDVAHAEWTWRLEPYYTESSLNELITKYKALTITTGENPGTIPASAVEKFNTAIAAAETAAAAGGTADEKIAASLALDEAYGTCLNTINPIVNGGVYYIVNDNSKIAAAGKEEKAMYIDASANTVCWAKKVDNDDTFAFLVTVNDDGTCYFKNIKTGLYTGSGSYYTTASASSTPSVVTPHCYIGTGSYYIKDAKGWTYCPQGNGEGTNDGPNTVWGYNGETLSGGDVAHAEWTWRLVPYNGISFSVKDGALVASGNNISAKSISSAMTDNSTVTSLDLSAATLADAVTADELTGALTGNQVAILPATSALEGQNLVVDGKCQSLVLTDKANFAPTAAFTATKVTYSKTGLDGAGWYSAVLPYSITVPAGMTVLNNATLGDGTITFDQVEAGSNIAANTPFIYKTADNTVAFEASNANIATSETLSSGDLLGTYTTIAAGSATGKLILNTDGSAFATATDKASIPAFRAYLNASASAKEYTIVINGETTGIATGEAINGTSETVDVYTISGTLVRSHADAITALQGLPKGIYIVNGKKIAK